MPAGLNLSHLTKVEAQSEACRLASTRPIQELTKVFFRRESLRQLSFRFEPKVAVFCTTDLFCSRDKYAFRPPISSNVAEAEHANIGGDPNCNLIWFIEVDNPSNEVVVGFKMRYHENVNGTDARRKSFTIRINQNGAVIQSIGEEIDISHLLEDAEDEEG